MPDPRPELTTTKISGGLPARLAALIGIGILAAVVYVGVAGRPPAPPAQPLPTLRPEVAEASATPEPTAVPLPPASPAASPNPTQPLPTRTPWRPNRELYSITTRAGDQRIRNILVESDGTLQGAVGTEQQPRGKVKLELSMMTVDSGINSFQHIGQWSVNTAKLKVGNGQGSLLEVHVDGRPNLLGAPRLVQSGYKLTIHGLRSARTLTLFFYIEPDPIVRPIGGDGLIGNPYPDQSSGGTAP